MARTFFLICLVVAVLTVCLSDGAGPEKRQKRKAGAHPNRLRRSPEHIKAQHKRAAHGPEPKHHGKTKRTSMPYYPYYDPFYNMIQVTVWVDPLEVEQGVITYLENMGYFYYYPDYYYPNYYYPDNYIDDEEQPDSGNNWEPVIHYEDDYMWMVGSPLYINPEDIYPEPEPEPVVDFGNWLI